MGQTRRLILACLLLELVQPCAAESAARTENSTFESFCSNFAFEISLDRSKETNAENHTRIDKELRRSLTYPGLPQPPAVDELCRSHEQRESASAQITRAAAAISGLLDLEEVHAAELIERLWISLDEPETADERSRLVFSSAQARLLSYKNDIHASLRLRVAIQDRLDEVFGTDSPQSFENRLRKANLLVEAGDTSTGIKQLGRLMESMKETINIPPALSDLTVRSFALANTVSGNEGDALLLLRNLRSHVIFDHGENSKEAIEVDEDIASTLIRTEDLEEALTIQSRALLWKIQNLPINHPKTLKSIWRLAYLYVANRRSETARALLEFILRMVSSEADGRYEQLLLHTQSRLASLAANRGDFVSAIEIWQRVHARESELLGPTAADTQIEASNLAVALMLRGDVQRACNLLKDTLGMQLASRPSDVWTIEFTRISYDDCLTRDGDARDLERARESLRSTWNTMAEHSGVSSPHTLLALGVLARSALQANDRAEGKLLLTRLVQDAERGRLKQTSGLVVRDASISTWIQGRSSLGVIVPGYRDLALLYAQDNELESALRISELARDRSLGDWFAEQEWRSTQVPAARRAELDSLVDRIQDYDERIAVASDIVERVRLESERTLAVSERGSVERRLRAELHLAPPAFRPPTIDELRAGLPAGTALVSVLHSGETWWALVIRRGAPARFVAFADPDLGRNADAWTRRLRGDPVRAWPVGARLFLQPTRPQGATGPYLAPDELGRRLGRNLLEPIAAVLEGEKHLVFVGDDELVGSPLQALPLGRGLALDRFELSYAPSLATYARWQSRGRHPRRGRELLGIAAAELAPVDAARTGDALLAGMQHAGAHPLPFARAEIAAIGALFPPDRTDIWTGEQASKANLRRASKAGELLDYRYVHFAAHAWAQPDQPESSAIALAGADAQAPGRGALTAAELAGMRMGSDLVTLSACDTGLGRYEYGRGLLGLAYASLAAGNRAALLSLWPVADDTTARFMQRFYTRLRAGQRPPAALASTQREFRASGDRRLSDPLVWAAFVIYGGY